MFCWGFCGNGCANVVLLRGKRGGVVDNCVAKRGGNSRAGNGTGFWDLFLWARLPVAMSKEQTTATAKYRDLSTAAAKCAAFGRDGVFH
jgi:hypothetical protein